MASRTVAEQFVEVLEQMGVKRIYGLVGDSLNPIVDAVRRSGDMDWVHVRHEEAAAFAAGAEAQITGELTVCAGSCGPGNTHLLQGLYDAHRNGAPVLALASHIPSAQVGTGYFQETHPEHLFMECSHFCETVNQPAQMPRLLRIGAQTALGRGGVAVLVLPGDVAHERAVHPTGQSVLATGKPLLQPPVEQVRQLAEALNRASTVTLFCGAGVRHARPEVLELADRVLAPVGHALGGKEWIQYDNPYDVGMSGLLGYGACYEATHEAELLVLLGTDFPYDQFLPQTGTVQIDYDPAKLGRRTVLDIAVEGDVAETLRAVLPLVEQKPDRSFLDRMLRRHCDLLEKVVDAYASGVEDRVPIHPEYVASVLDEVADDDAVFTVDTGMNNVWAARYLTPNGRRRILGSWRHGTMANAVPHAIGAQLAQPGRQVVSLSGDGGLAMLLGELLTVRLHDLPIKIVVFDNSSLGMVKLEMLVDGLPSYETDHPPVDFASIARAAGLEAYRIEDPHDVRAGLEEAFARPEPVLVDVVTDSNALAIPPNITAAQMKGFALAASKTVLSGGVGKMIDLARSNMRNIPTP